MQNLVVQSEAPERIVGASDHAAQASLMRAVYLAALVLLSVSGGAGAAEIRQHYAPRENLERVDAALISSATETIDIAAYVLTDHPVIDALVAAQERGVSVRLILDPSQRHDLARLAPLLGEARKKRRGPIMHLKSYAIDAKVLRTGSANFTASGLKQQNNDLLVIEDQALAEAFESEFERVWDMAEPVEVK